MRPTRLELEGFASFRDPTTVELGDTDLFVLAGPTGAGKSSLIDAIVFSLYGSVPRYDDRRRVAPVISQGMNQARVRLTFTVDSRSYTATRVVSRTKTGATTKEARLEELHEGGGSSVLAGAADELSSAVEDLLGLTFDHFIKTVVLPQGAFQAFMHAKPAERQDLLVELLDLDVYRRIASSARERARDAEQTVTVLERRLDGELALATEDALDEARQRVDVLEQLKAQIDEALPRLEALTEEGGRLREAADAARQRASLVTELRPPDGVEELSARRDQARKAVENAKGALAGAVAAREAAEKAEETLPDATLLESIKDLLTRSRTLEDRLESAGNALAEAEKAEEEATARLEEARERTVEARAAREHAQRSDLAATLAHGLEAGDDCPVCSRELDEVPEVEQPDDLDAARQALATAETAEREAAAAAQQAAVRAGRARTERDSLREQQEDVSNSLGTATTRLRDSLTEITFDPESVEELNQQLTAIDEAAAARRTASERERKARQALEAAETRSANVDQEVSTARQRFDEQRDKLASLEPPPADRDDLAGAWEALVAWADEQRPELEKAASEAESAVREARESYRELVRELERACAERDVEATGRAPNEACAAALERARGRVERIKEQIEQAAKIRTEIKDQRQEAAVAKELGQHLSARNFERWLLNRALRRLVVGATEVLQDLTGGAYSLGLDDDNQFEVIDHRNADETRSARTLSGGETFLAALSLALALSEHVADLAADGSARLDALFLDEGFGTLDADTLDTVASAIEELGARGRMVGIITHVRDLAERIPVRFEVRKTAGGSTVEKVVA